MLHRKNQNTLYLALLIVFAAFFLWSVPVFAGEQETGKSPQEVFKAAQATGAKKDYKVLVTLVAPSERPMMAFGTDMAVGMFVEFYEGEKAAELKKKYQKIQNKYKIKDKEEDDSEPLQITNETPQEVIDAHMIKRAKMLYGHVDTGNYVADLMAILLKMPEMADQAIFPKDKLVNLKIDGNKATGNAGEKNIKFIRENDRWYLTADVMD